jgi:proteasome assembly chaperone (PAC2) family protein
VHFLANPELRDPILVAGWPGMGLVAFRAVSYLLESLEPEPLAEFEPADIYPLRNVGINEGLIESTKLPESRAYFHSFGGTQRDLIIFLGEEQPVQGREWSLSNEILDLGVKHGVSDVYTFAAMVTHIDHRTHPRVWGCATRPELAGEIERAGVSMMKEGQISGLNGLLLGIARQRSINGVCLLGELPYYLKQISYPLASLAVLESFGALVGLELDLDELRALSAATQTEIDTYFEQIKTEVDDKEAGEDDLVSIDEPDDEDESEGMLN